MMDKSKLRALVERVIASASKTPGNKVKVSKARLEALDEYAKRTSQEEYAAESGINCPFCQEVFDVEFDDIWCLDGLVVTQSCHCNTCGETWDEEYALRGYHRT